MGNNLAASSILAFDIGSRRIGVAAANSATRLASPVMTLTVGSDVMAQIKQLVTEHAASHIVIGLPRNLNGDDTEQTRTVRAFAEEIKTQLSAVRVLLQDEALTSHQAEAELKNRKKKYSKSDIDVLAATYILEDYLRDHLIEDVS
ncbi:MAG: Holliday junction resolvase RuvX [Candidatus Saccharimonadales bacterium]